VLFPGCLITGKFVRQLIYDFTFIKKISLRLYLINRKQMLHLLYMQKLRNIRLYLNQKQNRYLLIMKEVILKMATIMIMMMNFLTFLMLRKW